MRERPYATKSSHTGYKKYISFYQCHAYPNLNSKCLYNYPLKTIFSHQIY